MLPEGTPVAVKRRGCSCGRDSLRDGRRHEETDRDPLHLARSCWQRAMISYILLSIVLPEEKPPVSYSFALADGQRWCFAALPDAEAWVRKFAAIMELEEACRPPGHECVLFFARGAVPSGPVDAPQGVAVGAPGERGGRWIPVDPSPYQGLKLFSAESGRRFLVEVGPEKSPEEEYAKMQQVLGVVFRQAIEGGGLPFHCALLEFEGLAVLLAGSGGAGKSTCSRLARAPFQPVSDDLSLIVRGWDGSFRVHPLPTWSDYLWRRSEGTWPASRSLPLGAIFFLEQHATTEIAPIGQGEASMLINALARQMFEPSWRYGSAEERRILRRRLFENAADVARAKKSFVLRFQASAGFWKDMERTLRS